MRRVRRRVLVWGLLTVLFAASGVTCAVALWSQQASVATTVTTGTWSDPAPAPGWAWSPLIQVGAENDNSHHPGFRFTWTPVAGKPSARYTVSLSPTSQVQIGPQYAVVGGQPSAWFRLHKDSAGKPFVVTLTATVDGVESAPITRTFTFQADGTYTLQ